jgi:hypothetical protein
MPLRTITEYTFRGELPITPVTGFARGAGRTFWGLEKVTVKGLAAECASTVERPVPPAAVQAYCLEYALGGVSDTIVNDGDVKPVWVDPVTGEVSEMLILFSPALFKDYNYC